jgi:hypothetical protein
MKTLCTPAAFYAVIAAALLISGIGIYKGKKEARLEKDLENSALKSSATLQRREILAMHVQNEGFITGHAAGVDSAARGEAAPSQVELHELALRGAQAISGDDLEHWAHGFEVGFSEGFKYAVKPAP